jgi:hypothetical protein
VLFWRVFSLDSWRLVGFSRLLIPPLGNAHGDCRRQ